MKRIFLVLVLLITAMPLAAQLQQSGGPGATTTITQGGNNALVDAAGSLQVNMKEVNGVTVLTGNGITGTGSLRVTVASDNTAFTVNAAQSGTWTVQPGNTANTTPWLVTVFPKTGCGTTEFDSAWALIPSVTTSVTATTTCVSALVFNNVTSTSQTVTVTDGQGTPVTVVNTFSIPGNSQVTFPFQGTKMTSGIKWSAGASSSVSGAVIGFQ